MIQWGVKVVFLKRKMTQPVLSEESLEKNK